MDEFYVIQIVECDNCDGSGFNTVTNGAISNTVQCLNCVDGLFEKRVPLYDALATIMVRDDNLCLKRPLVPPR